MAVATNLIVENGSEMELVGKNGKRRQTAIIAATGFWENFFFGHERCCVLVAVADGPDILSSF